MIHYMIDIETLATTPDAHVLAIALVKFDQDTILKKLVLYPDDHEQVLLNRKVDFSTLCFWLKFTRILEEIQDQPKSSLRKCLYQIVWFMSEEPKEENMVWAKSPSFDLTILKNLFGAGNLPWKFSNEHDVRTAYFKLKQYSITILRPTNPHDPLEDATTQALNVQNYLKV